MKMKIMMIIESSCSPFLVVDEEDGEKGPGEGEADEQPRYVEEEPVGEGDRVSERGKVC